MMVKSINGEVSMSSITTLTSDIDVDNLHQQFENTKIAELERHDFVEMLLSHIRSLSCKLQNSTKELRGQTVLAKVFQDQFDAAEKQLNGLQKAIDCDMFVLVVIDGDDTLFKNDYVRAGIEGGERAARDLHQALLDYLEDKSYFKHDYKIVTKIHLNLMGLSKVYSDANITTGPVTFQQFIQGFNRTYDLMEITDAGNGKEGADTKVKAEFNLFHRNLQCKQIMFAGSGDNSYGNLLRPHAPTSNKSETVTLIEALPFARELQALSPKFEVAKFDKIFRDTKISVGQPPTHTDTARRVASASIPNSALEPSSTASVTYANKLVTFSPNIDVVKVTPKENAVTANKSSRTIYINNRGQRVDKPIEKLDEGLVGWLKRGKFCNKYHLLRECSFFATAGFCSHIHGPALSPHQLDNLRAVARYTACYRGLDCDDPDCLNGHRCQNGKKCANWATKSCKFSDEMHRVDISSIKPVPVGY